MPLYLAYIFQVAQQHKALTARPDDLNLVPRTYMMGEVTPLSCLQTSTQVPWHTWPTLTQIDLGVVAHTFNPSTMEVEAGGSLFKSKASLVNTVYTSG